MSAEPLMEGPVSSLRLLPTYLATSAIGEAIQTERGRRILLLDLAPWQSSQRFRWRIEQRAEGTRGTGVSSRFLASELHFLSIRDLLTIGTIALLPRPSLLSTLTAESAKP